MTAPTIIRDIAPGATVHPDARIGRWCVIGPEVTVGAGTVLSDRVTVTGRTQIGQDNRIGSGCVLGGDPQDLKYRGGQTWLLIGDRNVFGVNVTAHVGTEPGGWVTFIGNDNVFADTCHIAHDCYILDRARLGRGVLLAGHILVETGGMIEEMTGVHNFARIGRGARVGPRTPVRRDVLPYSDFWGRDYYAELPRIRGLHEAGVASAGLDAASEAQLREVLASLFADETALSTKLEKLDAGDAMDNPEVAHVCQFGRESLAGVYGRYRETFRGTLPPEARTHLPEPILREIGSAS